MIDTSNLAVDRRFDRGVIEIQLVHFEAGLGGLHGLPPGGGAEPRGQPIMITQRVRPEQQGEPCCLASVLRVGFAQPGHAEAAQQHRSNGAHPFGPVAVPHRGPPFAGPGAAGP